MIGDRFTKHRVVLVRISLGMVFAAFLPSIDTRLFGGDDHGLTTTNLAD